MSELIQVLVFGCVLSILGIGSAWFGFWLWGRMNNRRGR